MRISSNIIPIWIVCCLLSGCKKNQNIIDQVPVDTYIYLNQPLYANLNTINNWVYIQGGSKGIIVYHAIDGFKAYDRSCTYDPKTSCSSIYVLQDNITCLDSCCGADACCKSKFIISDGGPISGAATIPLAQYHTQLNPDNNQLHIYN